MTRRITTLLLAGVFTSSAMAADTSWYKGNTHVHTERCGHADSTPEAVTAWYHERGYNFLVLSEHNIFIDPAEVTMPENKRDDFILVPGEEVTGNKIVHTTSMNSRALVDWKFNSENVHDIIQNHVDGSYAQGGRLILNHPNFHFAIAPEDVLPVKGLYLFELYNGHPQVFNFGDEDHPSTEEMWDFWLSKGRAIYGVSSDDAHEFKQLHPKASNAGRGWVMVRSEELTPDALTEAMVRGDFYSSSGVALSEVDQSRNYHVAIDEATSRKAIESEYLFGHKVEDGDPKDGFLIEFIGQDGEVLQATEGLEASFDVTDNHPYVRCKITFTTELRDIWRRYYAWTQPVFTDDRVAAKAEAFKAHLEKK